MFPNAAAANRSIFYDQRGQRAQRLRSLFGADLALRQRRQFAGHAHRDGVRRRRHRRGRVTLAQRDAGARAAIDNAAYLSSFPDSRSGDAGDVRRIVADRIRSAADPIFRSLFQAGERTAAGLAGGAGIVGQRIVADVGGVAGFDAALSGQTPEVRAPRPARSVQRSHGTFSELDRVAARICRRARSSDALQRTCCAASTRAALHP